MAYLDGLEKYIGGLLEKNNLNCEVSVDKLVREALRKTKNYFTELCRDSKGKECFLKVTMRAEDEFKKTLFGEIASIRLLSERNFSSFYAPKILNEGGEGNGWYIREVCQGEIIADPFVIDKHYFKGINRYANDTLLFLIELSGINLKNQYFSKINSFSSKQGYLEAISVNAEVINRILPNFDSRAAQIFSNYDFPERENMVLSHGDCHFGNLIFGRKLGVVDWGIHWGNIAEDFAKVWTSLWQFPEIQARLYDHFRGSLSEIHKKSFKSCFLPMVIYQGANKLKRLILASENAKLDRYPAGVAKDGADNFIKLFSEVISGQSKDWDKYSTGRIRKYDRY
ncbi:MAG: aminoglycoside phosphotransferase family protein [Patescibacteria group bacterium]